ncbi:unnamed protein product, partial [Prorocentrum cordatum]
RRRRRRRRRRAWVVPRARAQERAASACAAGELSVPRPPRAAVGRRAGHGRRGGAGAPAGLRQPRVLGGPLRQRAARGRERSRGGRLRVDLPGPLGGQDLDRLVALLRPRLPAAGPVLHPGCGMSQLPARLAACTGLHVLSLDGSPSCVAAMRRAHAGEGALAWELCDVRQLDELPAARAARAACAVEKGCLDALLCDSDEAAARYLAALARVLPPGGRLLLVSTLRRHRHFTPAFRVVEVVPLSEDLSGGSLYVCERLAAPATALDELD